MAYTQIDNYVYSQEGNLTQLVGTIEKSETIRIDNNIVADVSYSFDFDLGQYVEQSRVEREDVLVVLPTLEQQISELQDIVNFILIGGL